MLSWGLNRARSLGFSRRLPMFAFLASLCMVASAAVVVAVRMDHTESSEQTGQMASSDATLEQAASGTGWSVKVAQAFNDSNLIVALRWDNETSKVELLDGVRGQVTAQISAAHYPFIVRRNSARELLIADRYQQNPGQEPVHRLLVFDTASRLALKRTLELPKRIDYPVYAPLGVTLSTDERYLFYVTHEIRTHLPECVPTGYASQCDLMSVAIVDLGSAASQPKLRELPVNCGFAALNPSQQDRVVAACHNVGVVMEIDAGGNVVRQENFEPERGFESIQTLARNLVPMSFGFVSAQGQLSAVLEDGTVLSRARDGAVTRTQALPPGKRVALGQIYELPGNKLLIGYDAVGRSDVEGSAIFNHTTGRLERDIPLGGARFVSGSRSGDAHALRSDGKIDAIEVASSARVPVSANARFSPDVQVLIP